MAALDPRRGAALVDAVDEGRGAGRSSVDSVEGQCGEGGGIWKATVECGL